MAMKLEDLTEVRERITALADVGAELNRTSDEFGAVIDALDEAFNKLNLGCTAWIECKGEADDQLRLGYGKHASKWGLMISRDADGAVWLFNDAPRNLRAIAIDLLPELLTALAKATHDTLSEARRGLALAKAFAKSMQL